MAECGLLIDVPIFYLRVAKMGAKLHCGRLKLPLVLIFILFAGGLIGSAAAKSVTSIPASANKVTLSVTPNPAKVKQKVTLIATVTTGKPATGGTVVLFDGKLPLGSAQVVGNKPAKGYTTGTATLTTIVSPGAHSLIAEYEGTAGAPKIARSKRIALKVTGKTGSATTLTAKANAQHPNNYDFTADVRGFGFAAPSGTVDFADITSNTDLGNAPLDSKAASHSFEKALVIDAAGAPVQSVVADFNGDGFPDVATANAVFGASTMAVFLGKANGEFQKPVSYPTGYFTSGIIAGDFNNDGILDLAAMSQDGSIDLFLGNGDGTFQASIQNNIGGLPVAIVIGDFNRDGILDYATTDYFANTASISLGNGDGTFQTAVPYGVGSGPYYIAAADFNRDGYLDLTVVNDNDSTVSVLLGNGDGTFQTQKVYNVGAQVEFVATGDLNLDGKPDIVVANYSAQNVGVLLGNGDGTFQPQVTYNVGGNDSGIAIADLNGDGKPDLAVSYYHPEQIGVLLGKGDGTFGAVRNYNTGQTQGVELTIADLDGDGTPDIISSDLHASISVLLNVTATKGLLTDVAVPGTSKDTEKIVAKYGGDSRYAASKSATLKVKGSGAR
jgi:FG-GAP-like repeat/Bacterial Ig-like domain (group 3)